MQIDRKMITKGVGLSLKLTVKLN